jgi:hypothetical protein
MEMAAFKLEKNVKVSGQYKHACGFVPSHRLYSAFSSLSLSSFSLFFFCFVSQSLFCLSLFYHFILHMQFFFFLVFFVCTTFRYNLFCILVAQWISEDRAIAQVVSRWLPTVAARVRAWVWSSGICGGQSGAGAGFLRVLRFPLSNFIPPIAPQSPSPIIWGWYIRPEVTAVQGT